VSVIEIAKALIACPSVTPEDAGVMDVLQTYLEPLGFTVHRIHSNDPEGAPTENLYARLGDTGPNLCFAGHVDIVPAGDEMKWSTPPFAPEIRDGWLYGRGAEDMKGAIAAFVAALQEIGVPEKGSLSLLITGDEEGDAINGTPKVLEWLHARGETIDACLVGEPTNPTYLGEMCKVGRRGSITCALEVYGKQGHVAYPHLADNPVSRLVDMLHAMQHHALDDGTEFFPPSNFEVTSIDVGNPTVNLIPGKATAKFNIRFNNVHTGKGLEIWLHDICQQYAGEGKYALNARISGDAFLTEDAALTTALCHAVEAVTGHQPKLSTTGGTSDARFIKDICPVIEFGTTGMTAHQVDERVEVKVLEDLARVYAQFIQNYLSE